MPGVFTIDKDKNVVPTKDALSLVPELAELSDEEFKYIIIVYDQRFSPYWQKPIEERKILALKRLYGGKKPKIEEKEKVKKGIEAYKSITYDERYEAIDAGKSKLARLNSNLADPNIINSRDLADIEKAIEIVQRMVDKNLEQVIRDEEKVNIKGDKGLSWLEKMRRSRKLFELKMKEPVK